MIITWTGGYGYGEWDAFTQEHTFEGHCMMEDMEAVAHFGLMIFDELPIKSI